MKIAIYAWNWWTNSMCANVHHVSKCSIWNFQTNFVKWKKCQLGVEQRLLQQVAVVCQLVKIPVLDVRFHSFRYLKVISNTKDSVWPHFQTPEKRAENTKRSGVLLTNLEVFGNTVKHCLECLIYLSIETKTTEKTEKYNRKNLCRFRSNIQTPSRSYFICLSLMNLLTRLRKDWNKLKKSYILSKREWFLNFRNFW